jgi:hypothetical protein
MQTATEIITKGTIIEGATYEPAPVKGFYSMLILYKKEIYVCSVDYKDIICIRPID